MRLRTGLAIAAVALAVTSASAAAQRISITPTIGVFVPLRDQSGWSWTDCCIAGGNFTETLRTELSSTTAIGMKVEVAWGSWLGVEASVATLTAQRRYEWFASGVPNPPSPDVLTSPGERTTVTSLRLKVRRQVGSRADVRVGIGPSLVHQSREPLCGSEPPCIQDLTMIGPAVELALGFRATRRIHLEVGVVNNIYSVRYPQPPFPGREVAPDQSRFWQHDVMISAGFGFVL